MFLREARHIRLKREGIWREHESRRVGVPLLPALRPKAPAGLFWRPARTSSTSLRSNTAWTILKSTDSAGRRQHLRCLSGHRKFEQVADLFLRDFVSWIARPTNSGVESVQR